MLAGLAVDHNWYTGVAGFSRVVSRVGLLYIGNFFFVGSMSDGGKVTVAFVYSIVLGWNGRVDVSLDLLNIRHLFYSHCFSLNIINYQNGIKSA